MIKNPVVLLTGAGKGIGKAIFEELVLQSGSEFKPKIFAVSRTQADLDALTKLGKEKAIEVETLAQDLAAPGAPAMIYQKAKRAFGQIDVLINNAGVGKFEDFLNLTEADLDYVMNTNFKSLFLLTQPVYAEMKSRKKGQIIFVTSVAAEKPFEQSAIYCASKFAQKGLVEVLRLIGYKDGIRITNIAPGAVATPIWGEISQEDKKKMMPPKDVAEVVLAAIKMSEKTSIEEIVLRPIGGDF